MVLECSRDAVVVVTHNHGMLFVLDMILKMFMYSGMDAYTMLQTRAAAK